MFKKLKLFKSYLATKSWSQLISLITKDACLDLGEDRLRFRFSGLFGSRGMEIAIPRDFEIFKRFKMYGSWCPSTSLFLAESFKKQGRVLLDLGAHAGLISLQTQLFSSKTQNRIICVEPIPRHIDCIRFNMMKSNFEIIPKVLSVDTTPIPFYIDEFNFGNSSTSYGVVGHVKNHKLILPAITAEQIEDVVGSVPIVLKSDLQGFDSLGLSLFSNSFWDNVERGVVEVLATEDVEARHAQITSSRIGKFRNISWTPFGLSRISESDLLNFWISKSGEERDVYFWN